MPVQIKEAQHGPVTVLAVVGMVRTGAESQQLRERIHTLAAAGKTNLVLELSEVSFIDSHGVGELVACLTTLRKSGGNMTLANPSGFVRDVLRVTRLVTLFSVFDSTDAAIDGLGESDQRNTSE